MHEIEIWACEQFVGGVAEDALPGGVHPLEIPVESGQAEEVERQREEPREFFLGPLALHELPDVGTDLREHPEQIFVRLADFPAEEFHHADDLTPRENRQGK